MWVFYYKRRYFSKGRSSRITNKHICFYFLVLSSRAESFERKKSHRLTSQKPEHRLNQPLNCQRNVLLTLCFLFTCISYPPCTTVVKTSYSSPGQFHVFVQSKAHVTAGPQTLINNILYSLIITGNESCSITRRVEVEITQQILIFKYRTSYSTFNSSMTF